MTANQAAQQIIADVQELRDRVRRIPTLLVYIEQRAAVGDVASTDLLEQMERTLDDLNTALEQITGGKVLAS